MNLTEECARKLFCHRTIGTDRPKKCIASACMAWKFNLSRPYKAEILNHKEDCREKETSAFYHAYRGYCETCFEPVFFRHVYEDKPSGYCMDLKEKNKNG